MESTFPPGFAPARARPGPPSTEAPTKAPVSFKNRRLPIFRSLAISLLSFLVFNKNFFED